MKAVRIFVSCQALSLAVLSGCAAPVYDAAAVPGALSAQQLATDLCDARAQQQLVKTMGELMECYLTAEKQTADAIKLSKPELYENYRMRAQLLAWQFDQRAIGIDEFRTRFGRMTEEYYDSVLSAAAIQQDEVARQKAKLRAIGASLQQAGRALDRR